MAAWGLAHGLSHLLVSGLVSAARVRGLASSSSSKRDGLDYLPVSLKPNRRLSGASSSLSPLATIGTASSGVVR